MGSIRLKYFSIGVFLSAFSIFLLYWEKESKIRNHLQSRSVLVEKDYKVIYGYYKNISNLIFQNLINNDQISLLIDQANKSGDEEKNILRQKLFSSLKPVYETLLSNNLKQLHFHLKNNESFLRFHRPKKFGDDLSSVRSTVSHVNSTHKFIDGFEEGRIYNGFRFVFPLFLKQSHIGSVEISFSTLSMTKEFLEKLDVEANFLVKKNVVEDKVSKDELKNYVNSPLDQFYFEKETVEFLTKKAGRNLEKSFSGNLKKTYKEKIEQNDIFSVFSAETKNILTLKKIYNPVSKDFVALFAAVTSGEYIVNKTKNFYFLSAVTMTLIMSVCWFIGKITIYKEKIQKINDRLQVKIKEEVEKNRKKDQKIYEQSKMAQMGELISMIAHQWRQPLGAISSSTAGLQNKISLEKYDLKIEEDRKTFLSILNEKLNNISRYAEFLSKTIDDFRSFYKKSVQAESVKIETALNDTLNIVKVSMENNNIKFKLQLEDLGPIRIYKNEIMQVILNILKNADDNFKEKDMKNKFIEIKTYEDKYAQIIEIFDNGGGIREDISEKIFDPYFSTKEDKNGTGLGLYMSKMIIEDHHKGKITAVNKNGGVEFKIILPKG